MQGSLEIAIGNIWKEILGLQEVAPDANFFDLGGTSLHAARLVTKTRAAFGVRVSQQTVFQHPTLAAFAAEVGSAQTSEGARSAVANR